MRFSLAAYGFPTLEAVTVRVAAGGVPERNMETSENTTDSTQNSPRGHQKKREPLYSPPHPPACPSCSVADPDFQSRLCDPTWAASVSDFVRVSFSHDLRDLAIPARLGDITDKWIASSRRCHFDSGPSRQHRRTEKYRGRH